MGTTIAAVQSPDVNSDAWPRVQIEAHLLAVAGPPASRTTLLTSLLRHPLGPGSAATARRLAICLKNFEGGASNVAAWRHAFARSR